MSQHFLQLGGVVSIQKGIYRHTGIDAGNGSVIHASKKKRKVVHEPMGAFTEGKPLRYEGFPGSLSPKRVVERAAQKIGEPYRLFSDNCEHLVTHAHGLKKRSLQVEKGLIMIGCVLLALVVAKKARMI